MHSALATKLANTASPQIALSSTPSSLTADAMEVGSDGSVKNRRRSLVLKKPKDKVIRYSAVSERSKSTASAAGAAQSQSQFGSNPKNKHGRTAASAAVAAVAATTSTVIPPSAALSLDVRDIRRSATIGASAREQGKRSVSNLNSKFHKMPTPTRLQPTNRALSSSIMPDSGPRTSRKLVSDTHVGMGMRQDRHNEPSRQRQSSITNFLKSPSSLPANPPAQPHTTRLHPQHQHQGQKTKVNVSSTDRAQMMAGSGLRPPKRLNKNSEVNSDSKSSSATTTAIAVSSLPSLSRKSSHASLASSRSKQQPKQKQKVVQTKSIIEQSTFPAIENENHRPNETNGSEIESQYPDPDLEMEMESSGVEWHVDVDMGVDFGAKGVLGDGDGNADHKSTPSISVSPVLIGSGISFGSGIANSNSSSNENSVSVSVNRNSRDNVSHVQDVADADGDTLLQSFTFEDALMETQMKNRRQGKGKDRVKVKVSGLDGRETARKSKKRKTLLGLLERIDKCLDSEVSGGSTQSGGKRMVEGDSTSVPARVGNLTFTALNTQVDSIPQQQSLSSSLSASVASTSTHSHSRSHSVSLGVNDTSANHIDDDVVRDGNCNMIANQNHNQNDALTSTPWDSIDPELDDNLITFSEEVDDLLAVQDVISPYRANAIANTNTNVRDADVRTPSPTMAVSAEQEGDAVEVDVDAQVQLVMSQIDVAMHQDVLSHPQPFPSPQKKSIREAKAKEKEKDAATHTFSQYHSQYHTCTDATSQSCHAAWNAGLVLGFTRCEVLEVNEVSLSATREPQRVVMVKEDTRNGASAAVVLRSMWIDTPVHVGDIVNILGDFLVGSEAADIIPSSVAARVIVLSYSGPQLLVLHPDILLSGTLLAGSMYCMRESVLGELVKIEPKNRKPMITGTIIHGLFEYAVKNAAAMDAAQLESIASNLVRDRLDELYACGADESEVLNDVVLRIPTIIAWVRSYMYGYGVLEDGYKHGKGINSMSVSAESKRLRITQVLDTEEMFWSLVYGLKGFIDLSIQAECEGDGFLQDSKIMPVELKSGLDSGSTGHRAQVILYALAMCEKYNTPVTRALLVYVGDKNKRRYQQQQQNQDRDQDQAPYSTIGVEFSENDVRSLMLTRNRLADYLIQRVSSPKAKAHSVDIDIDIEDCASSSSSSDYAYRCGMRLESMYRDARRCSNCEKRSYCAILHHSIENGTVQSSGMGEVYEHLVSAVASSPGHAEYVRRWMRLIALEEVEKSNETKGIWTMAAEDRAKMGVCLSSMRAVRCGVGDHALDVVFSRIVPVSTGSGSGSGRSGASACIADIRLDIGDSVVISVDVDVDEAAAEDHGIVMPKRPCFGISKGVITHVNITEITVQLDSYLRPPPSIVEVASPDDSWRHKKNGKLSRTVSCVPWRIDRLEFGKSSSAARAYVISMFDTEQPSRLRELIVDDAEPRFEPIADLGWNEDTDSHSHSNLHLLPPLACDIIPKDLLDEWQMLNANQKRAVHSVLCSRDYALILGMPGTGKTAVTAYIIRALVALGQTVLIACYTHTAVDNILLKLVRGDSDEPIIPFLRVGKPAQVHDRVVPRTFQNLVAGREKILGHSIDSVGDLKAIVHGCPVVGSTVLGVRSPLLQGRSFDVCIIDEAGQIAEPYVLGPIQKCSRFVLVGDHNQLPPLIQSRTGRDEGAAISLFERLCEKHKANVVELTEQYRMNADVMYICNTLVYGGALKCGSAQVASARLTLNRLSERESERAAVAAADESEVEVYQQLFDPAFSVLFLNTDTIPHIESKAVSGVQNVGEATVVAKCVAQLMRRGVAARDIGVVTPYRAQLKLLGDVLGTKQSVVNSHIDYEHDLKELEMYTVDRYQGRDKHVIFISFVRSNAANSVGQLLKDWRRLNVAFSRAKVKLVMVGSCSTLGDSGVANLSKLIELVRMRGWVVDC